MADSFACFDGQTSTSADAEKWRNAMDKEFNYLIQNNSWNLTKLPKDK